MTAPADLTPERIASLLHTRSLGRSLDVRVETESTMDDARRAADHVLAGHVVVADTQTRGRGTHGRTWVSPSGVDLYFSALVRPRVELADLGPLTLAVGLGVAEAFETFVPPESVRIKWPNDVYLGGRKCAGILVESRSLGDTLDAVVIGIGANVNRLEFPADLQTTATSLALECRASLDRASVLARVLDHVEGWIDRFENEGRSVVVRGVDARLLYHGERARLDGAEVTVVGVDASGGLRVATHGVESICLAGRLDPAR